MSPLYWPCVVGFRDTTLQTSRIFICAKRIIFRREASSLMSDKVSSKPQPLMAKPQLTWSEAKVQSTTVVSAPAKPRIQNSWTTTNGVSGKICMVLFYAVILGKLAWAIKDLIYPKVCGCYIMFVVWRILLSM
jgi:predicted secreted protein